MKIISKRKDYFDYLVGYYGYDEHIVWDRRNDKPLNFKWQDRFRFYICGDIYPVIKKGRDFICSPTDNRLTNEYLKGFDRDWMKQWSGRKTDINAKLRQPVLCLGNDYSTDNYFIPRLEDFGFASIIEAHEMYERIYAFLGWLKDNPEIPNNQSDKEKIVAHGFNTKTSFRPTMKS